MSFTANNEELLDGKFYQPHNDSNDDILDEFLDQRVYDNNNNFSPDKSEFAEFYHDNSVFEQSNYSFQPSFQDSGLGGDNLGGDGSLGGEYISPLNDDISNNSNSNSFNDDEFMSNTDLNAALKSSSHTDDLEMDPMDPQIDPQVKREDVFQFKTSNDYELLRDEISKLKFGRHDMKVVPDSIDAGSDLLDFSSESVAALPYKLTLSDLPDYSRVETQIKINFSLNPPPPQNLIHLPQDLISKNKFCLANDLETLNPLILQNLLYLDCYVMTSNLNKSCNICPKCIKREQKRASRRRLGGDDNETAIQPTDFTPGNGIVKNNPNSWADETMIKKAIIFNCKEIVSFPPPNGLNNDKSMELSARIICYCRHHQESEGFKLLFVVKNYAGEIVAKQLSSSIMIMDRKKPVGSSADKLSRTNSSAHIKKEFIDELHPISPNSIDESSDLTTNESSERNLKRKKMSIDDSSNNSNNPMYNGSANGFSPVSNSDTNTSINNIQPTKNVYQRTPSRIPDTVNSSLTNAPTILRIIPAEGPIRGGIEVTLLGFNFNPNLAVKFGANSALATHCWSETTIVTYLPPASQPGQVLVSFEERENVVANQQQQIFTYTDDTDKQLIELALQIVGLKMNGKLEDAKNIARRIVGNDTNTNSRSNSANNSPTNSADTSTLNQTNVMEWYNNAQDIVSKLTKSNYSTEEILINFLNLVDLPNCPIVIPNWQLSNNEGQSLLHLSTIRNYKKLIKFLMNHGCKIDLQDNQGLTPLFYAGINGQRDLIDLFINCEANCNLRLSNDKTIRDYCDLNVLDLFETNTVSQLNKSNSIDSLNSMFEVKGLHVSKMVPETLNNDSEFADSEYSGDYSDEYDYEVDEEDDYDEASLDTEEEVEEEIVTSREATPLETNPPSPSTGIWQKVKKVFNASDEDLPNYNDLFPSGPSDDSKPKTSLERELNQLQEGEASQAESRDDLSDSSEDMVISYINHPRKTVENDKMLIFFWVPVLVIIISLFISMSVIGYKFESIENVKTSVRDGLGNLMVGNERIKRVFREQLE